MAFELFTEVGGRFAIKVSIRRSHQIGFNAAAVKEFRLKDSDFVQLYYDRETQIVGIKPVTSEGEAGAIKLRKRTTGADVAAKSFLDFYRIAREENVIVDATWDEKNRMILLDLKKSGARVSRKKSKE